ncbi:hypothetical protein P175DRAFT_0487634 [Aspergillus ochraceoroseus IBT 24754]|uniref:Uncharacterized protein n=1 Tax=Aspergillus ochraceoroseus IBT 24754 TaxID=1392256 RepID=A0A2T5LLY4_9EURO|nr:uncharacterized protein P175DRAFT_0487634 [Aspergillus ochraceoroseus IBT 24754]PTU17290.1 hypothetical protein P175DRAFT_0487634 [Aspergillus ochraceoroseus IBT 24754]
MAPSLRDLIDFLLSEIALCGDQGASPTDILSFIDVFYAKSAKEESNRRQTIDRRWQGKVWQWLTKNPEVSVGKNREGNGLSLAEVEQRQLASQEADSEPQPETGNGPIRVFVSKERTWLAITGHEPDETKVLPMEFALLSIIASRKSSGIAQPELIRLSGQDKRSVPKRTDVLQQKGYIEKRAIQIKAARTSLCTLRRFLDQGNASTERPTVQNLDAGIDANKMIDFASFTTRLFEILREYQIISRNDLKGLLGFADRWRWRILSRALRKFERIGVLKRVKALSQYADTQKKFHPCVMLVRDPTEKDFELFHEFSKNIYSSLEQGGNAEFEEDIDGENATQEPSSGGALAVVKREEDVEFSGRTLPVWSPDRNIHNQIFELIDRTGTTGSTNSDVIRACFGAFYRRPLENTLARLVECWQASQPPHLRHLAIVRDTALHRTITHYVHYSARNFGQLVDAGESSWEAVEFVPKNTKSDNVRVPAVDAKPQVDKYGFPVDIPIKDLLNNGNASLAECINAMKPPDYFFSSSDAKPVRLEDGTYGIHYGHKKLPAGTPQPDRAVKETSKRTPKRPKIEQENISDVEMLDMSTAPPPKKRKQESDRFIGMSEKEKLEALGLDETWTEYSVLLIDRPSPGVYVTPRGRRRPAGKRRGRPPISQLAVFKSPKLRGLPWFEAAHDNSTLELPGSQPRDALDNDKIAPIAHDSVEHGRPQVSTAAKGAKRQFQPSDSDTESESTIQTPSKVPNTHKPISGPETPQQEVSVKTRMVKDVGHGDGDTDKLARHPGTGTKRRRHQSPNSRNQSSVGVESDSITSGLPSTPAMPSEETSRAHTQSAGARRETPSKRLRRETSRLLEGKAGLQTLTPAHIAGNKDLSHLPENSDLTANSSSLTEAPQTIAEDTIVEMTPAVEHNSRRQTLANGTPGMEPSTPHTSHNEPMVSSASQTPGASSVRSRRPKLTDKGGSVAFLRKSIIMKIVEQAQGAYPMGSELWYPFMTAWMRTKYKEKPDLRTIKTAVKHLVDAGKLRQQTFCGRDYKGVMVTKTIVCKSDLPPNDPIIKDLQAKMLASDARYYFPPNVEIDPSLTKSGIKGTPGRDHRPATHIPVEPRLTVQLHQKPASVLAIERRRGQSIQRKLLQRIELEQTIYRKRPSGIVRLLSIQRPDMDGTMIHGRTSISQPDQAGEDFRRCVPRRREAVTGQGLDEQGGARRLKRLVLPISLIAPYAMLMNPRQGFHSQTGTFSTNAGLAAFIVPKQPSLPTLKKGSRLPQSLDDLFSQTRRRAVNVSGNNDPRSRRFFRDTDTILRWELQNEEVLQQKGEGLSYINQTIRDSFETVPVEGGIRFDGGETDLTSRPAARAITTRQRAPRSPNFVHLEPGAPPPASSSSSSSSPSRLPREESEAPYVYEGYRKPAIPQHRRLEKLNELMASDLSAAQTPRLPLRRTRLAQQLPRSMSQKLMTAIVVVRALAGGLDGRMVDWTLVSNGFPDQDPKFIQDKGKSILSKNRLQVAKMQSDFQEQFIEAYAKDLVPRINYDDLEGYDWNTVIEWANVQLDVPKSEKIPDLPATREQFDNIFELREESYSSLDEIFQNQSVTVSRKRVLYANMAFAAPLRQKSSHHSLRQGELSRLDTVKTWIRANITTPEEVYRPADARQALSYIDGGLIGPALQSLVNERVISQGNRGRVTPGRNYDITEHFLFNLSKRRAIELTEFRRATRFKTDTLDDAIFSGREGVYKLTYNEEDGDIIALVNLFAEGQVTFAPCDAPRDKFGLTEGGYLTRQMNKDKLRFPVEVRSVKGAYVRGNPVYEKASSIPPPCPPQIALNESTSVPGKIPLWYDIHGGFIQVLWELAVAAVLGCVATRPGITAGGIANMVKPTMGAWEIQMLLDWMDEAGVMRQEGGDCAGESGWMVQQWWWMVLG